MPFWLPANSQNYMRVTSTTPLEDSAFGLHVETDSASVAWMQQQGLSVQNAVGIQRLSALDRTALNDVFALDAVVSDQYGTQQVTATFVNVGQESDATAIVQPVAGAATSPSTASAQDKAASISDLSSDQLSKLSPAQLVILSGELASGNYTTVQDALTALNNIHTGDTAPAATVSTPTNPDYTLPPPPPAAGTQAYADYVQKYGYDPVNNGVLLPLIDPTGGT